MKYYLFMDESGDHGLSQVNEDFPVFLLCGLLVSEQDYESIRGMINEVKSEFWSNIHVVFHSRDIRKCEKEFSILFDLEIKRMFYERVNNIVANGNYTVIASAIQKEAYIKKFGRLTNDVYEIALSLIIERAVFFMDDVQGNNKEIEIIIEKRGANEDRKLSEHFQRLVSRGTYYVKAARLQAYKLRISFKSKRDNINGLQLADLIAYPIARYVLDKERPNPAFDLVRNKLYMKRGRVYGLKIHP